ncbi:MAG: flagellar basal body L-ring protein FlgH [Luteibacter sp.]|uniref:flagellar basal body L-ring protein FlgH n=1 Tax=Rhodanobacteraceae TaxID=1775411 RepID=UPI00056A8672|nr:MULTISPECIES: flagellar basal body L-ring protein FlgH [Rhodanobacteraceae]MDQ7997005.1 flagellar basal body L-ring protein FlgH [Luteibacter sp.]MDQ8050924.1 flagellar basal body L-ring protein FlgH [Luteibacter sp.]MDR6643229.1 flagellar L-ring protein precursor FlgH [Luteibacter sp. 1214]SDF09042.1 flagellar L-ring protein precursor FlgH [Dyella sp. 333MFSha]
MNRIYVRAVLAVLPFALLNGCAMVPPTPRPMYTATLPEEPTQQARATGSLYADQQSLELFADPRAHRVGDILTITLVESTQASKKAATSTSKKNGNTITSPTVLGQGLRIGGKTADSSLASNNAFDGDGSSQQSNQLSGEITVTVAQRLSNGALVVRGEKWLTINQGDELVRISGIVRPQDIGNDNIVASSRVADARIEYVGKGTLADSNTRGWLSRFFDSKWMPF